MAFAEQNINNSFEFAQKLVRAKDIQEVMALQQEFLKAQMQAMQAQARDLGRIRLVTGRALGGRRAAKIVNIFISLENFVRRTNFSCAAP